MMNLRRISAASVLLACFAWSHWIPNPTFGQNKLETASGHSSNTPQKVSSKNGFEIADSDGSGDISAAELVQYLDERMPNASLPHAELFAALDVDGNSKVSVSEFAQRHEVVRKTMGDDFLKRITSGGTVYTPFWLPGQPQDDAWIQESCSQHCFDLTLRPVAGWPDLDLKKTPKKIASMMPQSDRRKGDGQLEMEGLIRSSLILVSMNQDKNGVVLSGGVIISKDGLALTNYHVVPPIGKLIAMTADGKPHRVIELLAANEKTDVAMLRLEGSGFHPAPIARNVPTPGTAIRMLHHSGNRFFTYDEGYVKRMAKHQGTGWMEISADFSFGGSGCGIFNTRHELVGLVSRVSQHAPRDDAPNTLLVKHAVPLEAIHSLWSVKPDRQVTTARNK